MKKRAFTFIELAIVLGLFGVLSSALLVNFVGLLRGYHTAMIQADLKVECQRAGAKIFQCASPGGWRIHPDQSGITFADGTQLRLRNSQLWLGQQVLLKGPVRDFLATRQQQQLFLTFEMVTPARWQGMPRSYRFDCAEPAQP